MPYSPIKVANEILRLAREQVPAQPLTPLQLIKLVYIANGWWLAYRDEPLVSEPAQAWAYGPVMPSLYFSVRHHRASPVDWPVSGDSDPQELAPDARGLIASVFKAYGHLSGTQLSNMTHQPNTPWSETWNGAGKNAVIPAEKIAAHYKVLAQRRAA